MDPDAGAAPIPVELVCAHPEQMTSTRIESEADRNFIMTSGLKGKPSAQSWFALSVPCPERCRTPLTSLVPGFGLVESLLASGDGGLHEAVLRQLNET